MCTLSFTETTFKGPVFQIGRRENLHFLSYCQQHNPTLSLFMPEYFRIAKITGIRRQYRIIFIFCKRTSIICAIRNALYLSVTILRINCNNSTRTESGSIISIYYGRTAENCTKRIRGNSIGTMFPIYQVFTDCMSPMHIAPFGAIRVVLVEKVIFTISIYHPIGIVHPSIKR